MNYTRTGAIKGALLLASLFAFGMPAAATAIYGTIGFSGNNLFSFTQAGPVSFIDFQAPVNGGFGSMVSGGTVGAFYGANVPASTPGTILDLASGANVLGYNVVPPGVPVSIDNFITFATLPTTNYRLTLLPLAANCGGPVTCVGAFQLVQNGPNVAVSINLLGNILNGADVVPFSGNITAQFLGTDIASVIAGASSPTGVSSNSWSGAIVSDVPEPGTVTMLGIGLVAMVLGGRRMQRRS